MRCIAFLESGLEYEWPPSFPKPAGLTLTLMRVLRLRKKVEEREHLAIKELEQFGDLNVWPFVRDTDYQTAISNFGSL
jgi:hypothetical protein